jgi:hypothetical protein
MDITRLRQGEKIAGVSAILLFIFMFFDWFGVKVSGVGGSATLAGGGSAWDSLDVIPIILVIAIIAVLAMVVVRANNMEVDLPVSLSVIATALAALGTLLILFRIIDPPGGGSVLGVTVDTTRQIGLFLGFIAAAAMTYGSWRTMEEEGTSFGDAADRLGGGGSGGGDVGGGPPDVGGGPPDVGAGPGDVGGGAEPPSAPPPPPPPPPPSGAPPSA